MEIVKFPHPILFQKCSEVSEINDIIINYLDQMWTTMKKHNGLGLAANQTGTGLRMFVMEGPNKEKLYIIDPKLLSKSIEPADLEEGCLSAPDTFLVRNDRATWVQIKFKDSSGKDIVRVFHGLYAVCVQHEMEHLDGISYMQSKSIPRSKRNELAKKWRK